LTWNSQYQLISVATNGVFAEGYSYDALGRRVATTTFEGTVHHVYDNNWQCIADVDTNGNVLCSYMWGEGIDNLLAVKIGDDVYTALTDIQGTVWGFTDGNGEVVARWTYDAWGNVLSSNVTVPALASLRYRFQGREWSAVTGLMNFRMRWYDVVTGKWLSKDINGLLGGINLYMFSANNPLIFIDPRGGSPIVGGIGIAVVIIGISIIYYTHKKYEYAGDIEKQMKKGDQGDLKNVVANAVNVCKRMLREITSLFGPVPSTTSILTDPIDDFVVRPIVDDVFDPIKPSPSMNEDDSGLGTLKPLP
jgi:RHS repeat-associated protein